MRESPARVNAITTQSYGSNITSAPVPCRFHDTLGMQGTFTGTPSGSLILEGSIDYNEKTSSGNWFQIGTVAAAAGTVGNNFPNQGAFYMRLRWAFTSGTGNITGWVSAK